MDRYRTADGVATSVIFLRSNPRYKNKAILLVEGADDRDLFIRFLESNQCLLHVAGDKERVVGAITNLDARKEIGILGIVDAEFDILSGNYAASVNILFTDCHDIEAMIMSSKSYDDYISSLVPRARTDVGEAITTAIRQHVLQLARPIGILRYLSHRNKLHLSLKDYNKYIHEEEFSLDLEALIAKSIRVSTRREPSKEEISGLLTQVENLNGELKPDHEWYIYRGHDLTYLTVWAVDIVFSKELPGFDKKRELAGHVDTRRHVEINLRRTYDSRYFRRTKLFNDIHEWEKRNAPFQILASDL